MDDKPIETWDMGREATMRRIVESIDAEERAEDRAYVRDICCVIGGAIVLVVLVALGAAWLIGKYGCP